MKKFEYQIIILDGVEHQNPWDKIKALDSMGEQGWEILTMISHRGDIACYFKREIKL